jgi:hypothetical protein
MPKMPRIGMSLAAKISLAGAILILINGIWIAVRGGPVILTTDPNLTTAKAVEGSKAFWGRMSFGMKGLVEGNWILPWLLFTIVLFGCIIRIIRRPRKHKTTAVPIMLLSILSFPIGGGFWAGLILVFIGGMLALEWPKPLGETSVGRMAKIARLDSAAIKELYNASNAMRSGTQVLILISIVAGLGNVIYVSNMNLIRTSSSAAYDLLLLGKLNIDSSTIFYSVSFVAVIFLRWIILSSVLYAVTVKLKGYAGEFSKLSSLTAFALAPLCIQFLLPIMFSNDPYRTFQWPFAILMLSTLWVGVVVMAIVRSTLEIGAREALGVTIFAGILWWFTDNLLIASNPYVSVPGVSFTFGLSSSDAVLFFTAFAILVAALLGAFETARSA